MKFGKASWLALVSAVAVYGLGCLVVSYHQQYRLDSSLLETSVLNDSFSAAHQLQKTLRSRGMVCSIFYCTQDLKAKYEKVRSVREDLLLSAASQGDKRAISLVFDSENSSPILRYKAQALIPAMSLLPNPTPQTLQLAGEMYMRGEAVNTDYKRAYSYLSKSWAQGNKFAAASLARLFSLLNDSPNAYLWGLRCKVTCTEVTATAQSHLEANQILRIQSMAPFDKIMTAGTTPLSTSSNLEDLK